MRRSLVMFLSVVVLLGTLVVGGGALAAQDTDFTDNPFVGSWIVDSDPENPQNPPELTVLTPSGSVIDTSADGTTGVGMWEPTGDTTANVTFTVVFDDGTQVMIRAAVELAPDGQSFTGNYTNEFFDPSGEGSGEIGPGTVEGTRMVVEGPGTPIASFEDFFGSFEGTPEATPAP